MHGITLMDDMNVEQDREAKNNLLYAFETLPHAAPSYQMHRTKFTDPRNRIRVLQTLYSQGNKLHYTRSTQVISTDKMISGSEFDYLGNITRGVVTD